jgi:hypothetical protein
MMKSTLFIALILSFVPVDRAMGVTSGLLSMEGSRACAIDDVEGVQCWRGGSNWMGNALEKLHHPRQVSVSDGLVCSLGDEGLRCIERSGSYYSWNERNYSWLKNPRLLSMKNRGGLVLDDSGLTDLVPIRMYAAGKTLTGNVPALKKPRQLAVGSNDACALDDEGVKCWRVTTCSYDQGERRCAKNEGPVEKKLPSLKHPRQVDVGKDLACALEDRGVICWGDNDYGQLNVPPLKNPKQVSVGEWDACAIDENGVRCWGGGKSGGLEAPPLTEPMEVSVGSGEACALTVDGVRCWERPTTIHAPVDWVPKDLITDFFSVLKRRTPPQRSRFFDGLSSIDKKLKEDRTLLESKYLFYALLKSAIESFHSEYFDTILIPKYAKLISRLQTEAGHFEVSSIRDSGFNRQIALQLIRSALNTSLEFINPNDKPGIRAVIILLEDASSQPTDVNLQAALESLSERRAVLETLKNSIKSAFLVDVIDLAKNWLETKIK